MTDLWSYEQAFSGRIICGVDEAGRGPLAGPVMAAAVIFSARPDLPGLNDSKKLSPAKRAFLFDLIREQALAYAVCCASVDEIERLNILNASQLAMRRAVDSLSVTPDLALVDGNTARDFPVEARCIVKGDSLSASIAAASILAKVTRDREMERLSELYPQYAFAQHKGYPTKLHCERLRMHGPCPVHRAGFLKKVLWPDEPSQPTRQQSVGRLGEEEACALLRSKGYAILETNRHSRYGEIDIIAQKDGIFVFVEVKTRKNRRFAPAGASVDKRKQKKLQKTALLWLTCHQTDAPARFDVIEVYWEEKAIRHIPNAFETQPG